MPSLFRWVGLLIALGCPWLGSGLRAAPVRFESVTLKEGGPAATLHFLWSPGAAARHPVVLMPGALASNAPPAWSTNLIQEGWMLCAFSVAHPPDPDPARRPQWLVFDERFAHSYSLAAQRATADSHRVVAYLRTRADVYPDKIGWFGSSSTGIPGLAVATQGPRLAAIVAFVSTGAYRAWLETWEPNGLWRGGTHGLWPETKELLDIVDPILHASNLWPTATLLVNGGEDKVVDIRSARAFVEAARPSFTNDPARLRLVTYEGFAHNLPPDVVRDYAERWFRLYLHPIDPPPGLASSIRSLAESARQTQVNAAPHASIIGATAGVDPEPPVALGSRLELFTDDLLIGTLEGCSLKLHEPQPANVALRFEAPWEGAFSGYATARLWKALSGRGPTWETGPRGRACRRSASSRFR